MVRALEFIEGVPQLIVPDNARALIADPDRYEPRASDTVLDFARHYGTSVLPARPLKPQDKAKVESAVQVASGHSSPGPGAAAHREGTSA